MKDDKHNQPEKSPFALPGSDFPVANSLPDISDDPYF